MSKYLDRRGPGVRMRSVSDIDLRVLRVFVTVVECGGYAASQSRLNIGSSTISLHMTELEQRLSFRLCDRGRGGFRLTERGSEVYSEAKAILRSLHDFAANVSALARQLSGRLAIGMVDNLVTHPSFSLVDALRTFNQSPNKVFFDIITASREELERAVLQGEIHAAIGPFVRRINGLSLRPLFEETHRVYCGHGHSLFSRKVKRIDPSVIDGCRVVIRGYHEDFDRQFFEGAWAGATVRNLEAMVVFLLSGHYLGFLPDHVARPWIEKGALAALGGEESTYVSQHVLITRRGTQATSALASFLAGMIGRLDRSPQDLMHSRAKRETVAAASAQ
jgi:LysR family transcriptional regulator, transcriptional activator for bauABCD operon